MLRAEDGRRRSLSKHTVSQITAVNLDMFTRREQTTESLSTEVEDDIDKTLKEQFDKPPMNYKGSDEDLRSIKLDTTFDQKGKEVLDTFLQICIQHVLLTYETEADRDRLTSVQAKLRNDPMGLKAPNYSDTTLFSRNSAYDSDDPDSETEKYTATKLQRNLVGYHQLVYNFMRGSIHRYMDKPAFQKLKLWMVGYENDFSTEAKKNRLKKGTRIPWNEIKEYILTRICVPTLGSYHYLPLHRLKRTDGIITTDRR